MNSNSLTIKVEIDLFVPGDYVRIGSKMHPIGVRNYEIKITEDNFMSFAIHSGKILADGFLLKFDIHKTENRSDNIFVFNTHLITVGHCEMKRLEKIGWKLFIDKWNEYRLLDPESEAEEKCLPLWRKQMRENSR